MPRPVTPQPGFKNMGIRCTPNEPGWKLLRLDSGEGPMPDMKHLAKSEWYAEYRVLQDSPRRYAEYAWRPKGK